MNLPDVNVTAAGSKREINLAQLGVPAVVICHGQNTAQAAKEVNQTVRQEHPDAGKLVIASVIDLSSFPTMFRAMVEPEVEKAYHKVADKLPEGSDAADYVILLPDWDGKLTAQLGAEGSTEQAIALVTDAAGNIVGKAEGETPGAAVLEILG